MKKNWWYLIVFTVILAVNFVFYWGGVDNYFFSDDFEWLSRAVLMQDSLTELFIVKGRDFNPLFLVLLWMLIKIFGLAPVIFRVVGILTYSAVVWMFFYLLHRYFKINLIIAFSAAFLFGFNVFISEVVLSLSALVYSLSFLFFMTALTFYLRSRQPSNDWKPTAPLAAGGNTKRLFFLLFLLASFLTKETIILAVIPLFFYEKEKKQRLFIAASVVGMVLPRLLLQWGATGSYTGFLTFSGFFYKLYFILLRCMNISPYALPAGVGTAVILLFLFISIYYYRKNQRGFLFFLLFMMVFALFFSLLPKLSSRYFLFPSLGFWGIAGLLVHHFHKSRPKFKILPYVLVPLVLISFLFNYFLAQKEIEDYRILGDFSRGFIREQAVLIKHQINKNAGTGLFEVTLYKGDARQLAAVYRQVINRGNLPKLLPFRPHGIDGVMKPGDLIPLAFYPDKIVRWRLVEETDSYFKGKIEN